MERRIAKNKKIEEEKKMVELARNARKARTEGGRGEESREQIEEAKKREDFRYV
jgi:hypothetical protein